MSVKFVNLTLHDIAIRVNDDVERVIPPSGQTAYVAIEESNAPTIDGVPVIVARTGDIVGLPDPAPDTIYVVSMPTAQAARRPDVVSPDTGPTAVREAGRIVAVRRLRTFV